MASKGLRSTSLSRCNEIDAGDELRIPQKPFLAILRVTNSNFYLYSFSNLSTSFEKSSNIASRSFTLSTVMSNFSILPAIWV